MLNARQQDFQAHAQPERLNHIRVLSAPVGSGKTEAIIDHIRDNNDEYYIYVTPTRNLAKELMFRLEAGLVNHWPQGSVHLIISEDDKEKGVLRRILEHVRERKPDQRHVLIITTKAFRSLLPQIEGHHKSEYNVFLDEGIDSVEPVSFSPDNPEMFMKPITELEDGSFGIADNGREILEMVAHHPAGLAAIGQENLRIENYIKLAELLVSGVYDVYGTLGKNLIQAVAFLRPDHFLPFKSVTIIMAIFEQSLLALFWDKKYGIKFRPFETKHDLLDTHRVKGPSMRIHYVLHPDDTASRTNLERHWQTGAHNADPYGQERVIDRAAMAVEERFGKAPYCWTANKFFSNDPQILTDKFMPVKCAGLDDFRRFDVVVALASMNPQPWVKDMIVNQVEITDADLYERWKIAYTYQTIGRCSVRDRESHQPVEVVVISRRCAEQIQGFFEGSEIVGQLTDIPSFEAMRQRRGLGKKAFRYENKDNKAWGRFKKNNPDAKLTKEEWYEQNQK